VHGTERCEAFFCFKSNVVFLSLQLIDCMHIAGMIEPWEGIQTTLHCALDDSIPANAGKFYSQDGMYGKVNYSGWPLKSPNDQVHMHACMYECIDRWHICILYVCIYIMYIFMHASIVYLHVRHSF
jgi:hypothetical protein